MLKLFSGSANPRISADVAKFLKIPLAKAEITRFGNSEVKVTIQEDVKDLPCAIIQPTSNPTDTHLMELFFFCDALKRQESRKIIGIIPYFGYARQNIQHLPGESVSVNVIIRFLETVGFDEIWTFDIHEEGSMGIFSIPFKNLSAFSTLAKKIKDHLKTCDPKKVAVIAPDQGGIERARNFVKYFYTDPSIPIVIVEKNRDLKKIHKSEALDLYGEVKDKIAIVVDDIVTSGGTLLNAANLCLTKGAKKIYAAIVHHDFSNGASAKIQNSPIEKFFTTNTIELKENQKFEKLEEFSVANLISQEIYLSK